MTVASFQSTVNILLSFGVPGELIVDGPQRAEPLTLDLNGGTVGYAFTKNNSTNVATMGGTIGGSVVFAGILVNPKVYASFGATGGNPIDPTLSLVGYTQAEFLTMGTIVVSTSTACNIGDLVQFNNTTGALSTLPPTTTFTASQTTTVLTVTGTPVGNLGIGSMIYAASGGAFLGEIISLGTGTGGAGTYNMSTSASVGSESMTSPTVSASTGNQFVPNAIVYRYPSTAAGLIAIRITE
jgi:hypothetical protein